MTRQHAEGTFEVTSWSETPAPDLEGAAKVAVASIGQRFAGDVVAETVCDTIMTYREDGTAEFVGYQRVLGQLGGRSGSFVLQGIGTYDGATARTQWSVVPGSATGDLEGLRGTGSAEAPTGPRGSYALDYELG